MTAHDLVVTRWGTRFCGRHFPSSVGRGGITATKREGDGATPIGELQIVAMLYRADRIIKPAIWATPIGPQDLWADDVNDDHYNQMVRMPYSFSHERLARADPQYDLVFITDWNWPVAQKGLGSAIFVHTWRKPRHPTAGCVAFAFSDLLWIAKRISPGTRLIING